MFSSPFLAAGCLGLQFMLKTKTAALRRRRWEKEKEEEKELHHQPFSRNPEKKKGLARPSEGLFKSRPREVGNVEQDVAMEKSFVRSHATISNSDTKLLTKLST